MPGDGQFSIQTGIVPLGHAPLNTLREQLIEACRVDALISLVEG